MQFLLGRIWVFCRRAVTLALHWRLPIEEFLHWSVSIRIRFPLLHWRLVVSVLWPDRYRITLYILYKWRLCYPWPTMAMMKAVVSIYRTGEGKLIERYKARIQIGEEHKYIIACFKSKRVSFIKNVKKDAWIIISKDQRYKNDNDDVEKVPNFYVPQYKTIIRICVFVDQINFIFCRLILGKKRGNHKERKAGRVSKTTSPSPFPHSSRSGLRCLHARWKFTTRTHETCLTTWKILEVV